MTTAAAGVRVVAGLALRAVVWRAEGTREKLLLLRIQRNGREAARWPELSTASTSAAAGARASSGSVLGGTAGGIVGVYGFMRSCSARWWAQERAAVAVATATPWPAARSSRPRWELGRGGENGGGEHRRSSRGSQQLHSRRRRGRGSVGGSTGSPEIRAAEDGGRRRGRRCRAPGIA